MAKLFVLLRQSASQCCQIQPKWHDLTLLDICLTTLMTEINIPRTFIDFWIFSHQYGPYFRPYAYQFSCQVCQSVVISMSDHSKVHLHSFNLSTKTVSLALSHLFLNYIKKQALHTCFDHGIFPPVRLFQTVRLLFYPKFPSSMFIPDRTFISVLRVCQKDK